MRFARLVFIGAGVWGVVVLMIPSMLVKHLPHKDPAEIRTDGVAFGGLPEDRA